MHLNAKSASIPDHDKAGSTLIKIYRRPQRVRRDGVPELKTRYHQLMREFLDKHFQPDAIERQIDELAAVIEPAVTEDRRDRRSRFKRSLDGREHGLPGNGPQVDVGLKQFVVGRISSLREQVAGRSDGQRARFGAR